MRSLALLAVAVVLSSTAACARVRYTPLSEIEREPLEADAPVEVLTTGLPSCPYHEIGILRLKKAKDLKHALGALRKKARQIGADTVYVKSYDRSGPGSIEAVALHVHACRVASTN